MTEVGGTDGPVQDGSARRALIVAGPTCSGKSALALAIAARLSGTVINADSVQVYRELRVLTARPTVAEEALVPHRLYGVRAAAEPGSVAWWRDAALRAMESAWAAGSPPILCGGTGMYLRALTTGLRQVPDPGPEARNEARALLRELGSSFLHARLREVDPGTAAGLRPSDGQRVARAWEVWRGTGRGLAAWAEEPELPPAPCRFTAIRLDPPRDALRAAIGGRFRSMVARGAVEEVRALLALDLPAELPAMRAHGVPELRAVIEGTMAMDAAMARATLLQGQYTKRQATWFNHHPLASPARTVILRSRMAGMKQQMESLMVSLMPFVVGSVDAPVPGV